MIPSIKAYRGYTSDKLLMVFGHVFEKPLPPISDKKKFKHAISVIRNFRRKTLSNADVCLRFEGKEIYSKTLSDGYFRFAVPLEKPLKSGWHKVEVEVSYKHHKATTNAEVLCPFKGQYAFISDIDDTFLVSYTNNIFKKLYALLWRNVYDRKHFEDVTAHYQLLNKSGRSEGETNAFFYVSSSEWNLYSFIIRFTEIHQLPKAVLKLKNIKTSLTDFLMTGRGSHQHKFQKIKDIIEFHPHLDYVLLGDDSQADPDIYEQVCKHFPLSIKAIYIRQTKSKALSKVQETLKNINSLGVETCYFDKSAVAIAHSQQIGII